MKRRKMGVVCTYFGIFLALNSVLLLGPVLGQHSHDHGHHHHHDHGHGEGLVHDHIDPFLTVKTHVVSAGLSDIEAGNKDAILSAREIHEVVSTILDRLNCTKKYSGNVEGFNCSVCSSVLTNRIFDVLEVNQEDGLNEAQFEDAAPILLNAFTTSNFAFACDESATLLTPNEYLSGLASRQGTPDRVTKEEMTAFLESLHETYIPATLGKCFDTDELFREVYDVTLGASLSEMSHLAPLIVAYLLEGYCIGPAQYPNPDSFLEDIVAMYGHDGAIPLVDLELILSKLGIGESTGHSGHGHSGHGHSDHSGHDHSGHNHRRRRGLQMDSRETRETHDHSHDHGAHDHSSHEHAISNVTRVEEVAHTCFSAEELFQSHGFHLEDGLNADDFKEVCPALLQQQLSGACSHNEGSHGVNEVSAAAYLYGTLCVLVVSLCAIAGGMLIPLLKDDYKEMILGMLVAMAVSTLSGDALIHLIPLATGLHVHEVPHDHSGHDHADHDFSYVWKTFLTLLSLYAFFLLEAFMSMVCAGPHVHTHGHAEASTNGVLAMNKVKFEKISKDDDERVEEAQDPTNVEDNHKHKLFKYGSLPIMILLSDAFHNFCDGLAMGASFAASIGTGLSTSVAVFCHELPHELGDLAILLKSGMKLKWALFLNFLSALTCFLGFYIGIVVGSTLVTRQWILSITAGMFLYVGLVDMMPQILNLKTARRPVLTFILQNVGFLFGAFTILAISYLEESISITI